MAHQPVRIGIIGAGRVGVDWQLPDIRAAGGEAVALADSVPGRAARFAAEKGIPHAFDDLAALFALPGLEAVTVCTPPSTHAEISVAALRAGKHVYLEKPPTMNEPEMRRVADAAAETGRLVLVGSNAVYWDEIQFLKRAIDRGELGEIYLVECISTSRRRLPGGWLRVKAIAGGGIAFDSSSHTLDHALYLLGTPEPVSVTGRTYRHFADHPFRSSYEHQDVAERRWREVPVMDTEDTVVAMVQFASGCTMLVKDCYAANLSDGHSFRISGTKAGASLHPLTLHTERSDGTQLDTVMSFPAGPGATGHERAFRHFFECIREGRQTESPPQRGIVTMRILDAIYASASAGGRQVTFDAAGRAREGG
jgi:predicted dehydrogenase